MHEVAVSGWRFDLFCEGWREEETLSSQNFLMASVLRAWSALLT